MSAVRMCDKCGVVFAEGAEGAATFTGSVNRTNPETGRKYSEQMVQDNCPDCAGGGLVKAKFPKALEATVVDEEDSH